MAPSKLCRRTYFLRSGTAPTLSEMRTELGPELADIIVDTLQPSQRAGVQPDCIRVSGELAPADGDSERVRGQIHEHILRLGGEISERVEGYWRDRLHTAVAAAGTSADDLDFLRFQCRQKVAIARDEERRRYDTLLRHEEESIRRRYWEERGELHRSYGEARALWAQFVCRKVRLQAKEMLCKIAARYRTELQQQVNRRMHVEKARIIEEMEQIVKTAVEQQKRMDERAIQWLVYQYEELLKFVNEYDGCMQAVEITRELCSMRTTAGQSRSTQVSFDSATVDDEVRCPRIDDLYDHVASSIVNLCQRDALDSSYRLSDSDRESADHFSVCASPDPAESEAQHITLAGGSSKRSSVERTVETYTVTSPKERIVECGATSSIVSNLSTRSQHLLDDQRIEEPVPARNRLEEKEGSFDRDHLEATCEETVSVTEPEITLVESAERSPVEKIVIAGLTYAQPKEHSFNELFEKVSLCWKKLDPVEPSIDADGSAGSVAADRYSTESESGSVRDDSNESEPSYRESYDPMVEISRSLLPSEEYVPIVDDPQEAPFGVFFHLTKSESEIAEMADGFTQRYIRATSEDFELMFPKANDTE